MVVDLETGYYYVLSGSAAAAWPLLARGSTAAEAAADLSTRYDAPVETIAAALDVFVGQLVGEQLLAPATDLSRPAPHDGDVGRRPDDPDGSDRVRFDEPTMTKYVDMANLVQMDPIREFEERRWPKKYSFRGRRRAAGPDDA